MEADASAMMFVCALTVFRERIAVGQHVMSRVGPGSFASHRINVPASRDTLERTVARPSVCRAVKMAADAQRRTHAVALLDGLTLIVPLQFVPRRVATEATAPLRILAHALRIGWDQIVALRAVNKAVKMEANALHPTHAAVLLGSRDTIAPNRSVKWDILCRTMNLLQKTDRCIGLSTDPATSRNGATKPLDSIVPNH